MALPLRPRARPSSISLRYSSQILGDGGEGELGALRFCEKRAIKSGVTWPVLPPSRGSLVWPVLPVLGVPTQAGTPPLRLFLDRRSRFPCAHRWLPRCAVRTIRASLVR